MLLAYPLRIIWVIILVPLFHGRKKIRDFDYILDMTSKHLDSCKAKYISFAGSVTLAQSVLSALPNYVMQSCLLPKSVIVKLDQLIFQFIWGCLDLKHTSHSVGWDKFTLAKDGGGLGFHKSYELNKAYYDESNLGGFATNQTLFG